MRHLALSLLAAVVLLVYGCGGGSSVSAKNITCKEVGESTEKTAAVAKQVVSDAKGAGGKAELNQLAVESQVNQACEGAKAADHAYDYTVGRVAALTGVRHGGAAGRSTAKNITCGETEANSNDATLVAEQIIVDLARVKHHQIPEAEEVVKEIHEQCKGSAQDVKAYADTLIRVGTLFGAELTELEALIK